MHVRLIHLVLFALVLSTISTRALTSHPGSVTHIGKLWQFETSTNQIVLKSATMENGVLAGLDSEGRKLAFVGNYIYIETGHAAPTGPMAKVTISCPRGNIEYKLANVQGGPGAVTGVNSESEFVLIHGNIRIDF